MHITERQPSEGRKDEDISHNCNPIQRKLLVVDTVQFVQGQKLTDDFFLVELDSDKRVFGYPFVGKCEVSYLLQALHITDDRILLALLFRLEIKLKSTN